MASVYETLVSKRYVCFTKRMLLSGNQKINLKMTLIIPALKDMLGKSVLPLTVILNSDFRNLDAQCKSLGEKRGPPFQFKAVCHQITHIAIRDEQGRNRITIFKGLIMISREAGNAVV